ncbi:MAG: alpha/beta hydrolase [Burkholderiales bacterium]
MKLEANGIDIEVEDSGGGGPAVLLIMGLGMQLVGWPPDLVQGLVDAGYRVIRHDNRDVGLSRHFDEFGVPNLLWALAKSRIGIAPKAPYSLEDMARDSLGVLDALGVREAHVVGASMGGMIAQRVALLGSDRLWSLTSIMSTSGAPGLPGPGADVMRAMFGQPKSAAPEHVFEYSLMLYKLIGSPAFPMTNADLRDRVVEAARRSFNLGGVPRQMLAIAADTTRAEALPSIRAPTLVLHGTADVLVPFACGEDTARRIPGARLVPIEGMGHDLPPGAVQRLLPPLIQHLEAHSPAARREAA